MSGRFDRLPNNSHITADETINNSVGKVAKNATFQNDAVFNFRVSDCHVVHDGRERTDIRMFQFGLCADDGWPTHD